MASKAGSLSYTFELRDTGSYGFVLPKEEIIPLGEEIWAAMKVFIPFMLSDNVILTSATETTSSIASPETKEDMETSASFMLSHNVNASSSTETTASIAPSDTTEGMETSASFMLSDNVNATSSIETTSSIAPSETTEGMETSASFLMTKVSTALVIVLLIFVAVF
jgi:hypothetical protein